MAAWKNTQLDKIPFGAAKGALDSLGSLLAAILYMLCGLCMYFIYGLLPPLDSIPPVINSRCRIRKHRANTCECICARTSTSWRPHSVWADTLHLTPLYFVMPTYEKYLSGSIVGLYSDVRWDTSQLEQGPPDKARAGPEQQSQKKSKKIHSENEQW